MIWTVLVGGALSLMCWTGLSWCERRLLTQQVRRALHATNEPSRAAAVQKAVQNIFGVASRRRWKNLKEFPDFLDLLSLGISAGLTLEAAWGAALAYLPVTPLTAQLRRFLGAVCLGRARRAAFRELAARLDDGRLGMTFTLLEQSMVRGGTLQEILQDQARALRQIYFVAAEKKAQTMGLRLLLPIFLFIFPTVFLLLFAPLAIRVSQGLSLF